jgi:hypothetical protein
MKQGWKYLNEVSSTVYESLMNMMGLNDDKILDFINVSDVLVLNPEIVSLLKARCWLIATTLPCHVDGESKTYYMTN